MSLSGGTGYSSCILYQRGIALPDQYAHHFQLEVWPCSSCLVVISMQKDKGIICVYHKFKLDIIIILCIIRT
jgi:hypothetical protein